jgi:hypothetical protein
MTNQEQRWPALPVSDWQPTYDTLHMYTQIIGKILLALRPMTNHWWQVALELSGRGLRTGAIPHAAGVFEMDLDLVDHVLRIGTASGGRRTVGLGRAVRDFYTDTMTALDELGRPVPIWTQPVEVPDPVPFDQDTVHASYEPAQAERYWHVLCQVGGIFEEFRARFIGKASPVQFYWGSFDLATTRYSGRPTDPPPNADVITRFSYTAEQSSFGFWPGGTWLNGTRVDQPVFYAYTYPEPPGIRDQPINPASAYFDGELGEFVLRYDDVRLAHDPRRVILDFAQTTYEAGARLQRWSREVIEWTPPTLPSHCRAMSAA